MHSKKIICLLAVLLMMFAFACGPKPQAPQAELDTPEHHVNNGNKFLKVLKFDEAMKEFTRAIELDPKYSPAFVGQGLVFAYKSDFEKAIWAMKKSKTYATDKKQEMAVHVGFIRVYTLGGKLADKKWLKKAELNFKDAVKIDGNNPEPCYYMGVAYKQAYEFAKSAAQFRRVLEIDTNFVEEADKEYEVIQKIERAMPGTSVGKKIALLDAITRADIAALFIEELEVDKLFAKRTKKKFDTAFKDPEKDFKTGEYVKATPASDIETHVLKADIDAVIAIGIKGLQPYPDHTFQPDKMIKRAEFAMMIQDILVKITMDDSLETKFIGAVSPFPDLRSDLAYFNAVMVCTTRNIMVVKDVGNGEFGPQGLVSGADALLSLRTLKTQLQKY